MVKAEQGTLRRILLGLCCGDSARADDLAQDTLLRAYVAADSFSGSTRFRAWLLRIAYNCFIDNLRRLGPPKISIENREASAVHSDSLPDVRYEYQELYDALSRLPEKERSAIVLKYFEDLPVKEIAAVLKIPSGTVKYYLSIGRKHLKQHLSL